MSIGVQFKNKYGNVLMSSQTKTLHLVQRIDSPASSGQIIDFAGNTYQFTYNINLATTYTPSPFFTIPNGSQQYVGITRLWKSGGQWQVQLISNQNVAPQIYIFAEPSAAPSYGNYGFAVRDRNGVPTYDTTKAPLVVRGDYDAFSMNPTPSTPGTSGLSARFGGSMDTQAYEDHFSPTGRTTLSRNGSLPAKPIFQYFSTPQAQTSVVVHEASSNCTGFGYGGVCLGIYKNEGWISKYWCYYRTGISTTRAQWLAFEKDVGHAHESNENVSFFGINLGDLLGLLDFDNGSYSGGIWPYDNESFNLNQPPIIFSDGLIYDQVLIS